MKRVYDPAYLGLEAIDLQDDSAPYASPILYVGNQFQWNMYMPIDNTDDDATAGLAQFTATYYDSEAGTNVVATKALLTDINTKVDGQEVLSWGGAGASKDGTGTKATGADAFSVGSDWMRITVTVTEVNNDGAAATADVWLVAEEAHPA